MSKQKFYIKYICIEKESDIFFFLLLIICRINEIVHGSNEISILKSMSTKQKFVTRVNKDDPCENSEISSNRSIKNHYRPLRSERESQFQASVRLRNWRCTLLDPLQWSNRLRNICMRHFFPFIYFLNIILFFLLLLLLSLVANNWRTCDRSQPDDQYYDCIAKAAQDAVVSLAGGENYIFH